MVYPLKLSSPRAMFLTDLHRFSRYQWWYRMLNSPLLTLHEVADLLKVKEATIRAWIQANDLRAIKFGREWRGAQKDLESYLNAHANKPADLPSI